jgi:hypothetical protein
MIKIMIRKIAGSMVLFFVANVKATHPLPGAIFNEGVVG